MLTDTIQIRHLSYTVPGEIEPIFNELDLIFSNEKVGLIGNNGAGKSTLLRLIVGELEPSNGKIITPKKFTYLSQVIDDQGTVAYAIGVEEKLNALDNIVVGVSNLRDFAIVDDDWLIRDRIDGLLKRFKLQGLPLDKPMDCLSGGEKTRLALVRLFIQDADFIILDEPTNNLDSMARNCLYHEIKSFSGGAIIACHDRALLEFMDRIMEISSVGVKTYGGNYSQFVSQKDRETQAIEHRMHADLLTLKKAKILAQERMEKHQRNVSKGLKKRKSQIAAKGAINKIELNTAKGRSEKSNRAVRLQANKKLTNISQQIVCLKEKVETNKAIDFTITHSTTAEKKVLINLENISFSYDQPLLDDVSLMIQGQDRIALMGENGSGKTTLLKLLTGQLKPHSGRVISQVNQLHYLDQHATALHDELTVLENFRQVVPTLSEFECRTRLASFLFRNASADKLVSNLSGGERVRALLACILSQPTGSQLIVLDEPTNHLDLSSIAVVENALRHYPGALLLVSHDRHFLENIGITRWVNLQKSKK